jgi:multidrug efflux system outer membrane protein
VVSSQSGWKEQNTATNTATLPVKWWQIFNDAELDSLEAKAVEANQDLKRAFARIAEARALARVSKADLYPTITAGGSYSRNRISGNGANTPSYAKMDFDDFNGSVDLSYELDAWGRVRRSVEAANADAAAVATDLQVVLLTLTADVARNYHSIRSFDNERAVIEATIALRRDAVHLQETRHQAGLINEVDVSRAKTELANVEAEFQTVLRNRAQAEHALALLCGQSVADFSLPSVASKIIPPNVPAGLPSSLLQRRPDIVEAEEILQGSSARIGVAKAAFFPVIKLTSTAGFASADLGTLVDWPSRFASIGPSVSLPIFEGGRNRANLKATEARYEQAAASYRGTILNAFREVEDALSDLSTLALQSDAVSRAVVSAHDTASLASERYAKGLSNYLDVVDAERAALDAERQDAQLRGQRNISTIFLAKALGGGWEGPE